MRVAVVCPYDLGRPGGVQQLTTELVSRLVDAGEDAWLVGPGDGAEGVRTVGSTMRVRANASVVPVALSPLTFGRVEAAVEGADVVHIHEPLVPFVSQAAMRLGVPRVVTFHADAPRWVRRLYRTAAPIFRRGMGGAVVTAVSPVAAAAVPPSWGEVEIIPNALDVAAYAPEGVERRPSRVAFLGRDDPRKGLDVLLEAWERVHAEQPASELVVIGARRGAPPAGVHFVGRVGEAEKRRLLASAQVYAAPNTGGESFGIVLAEAMAGGAAVVASNLPAFRHVLGGAGVHVPVGDPAALAKALVDLLASPAEARRLASAGRRRVADFDWPVVLERYRDAYRRAAG